MKLYGESCQSGSYFGIWLKSEKFSVVDRNVIPTGSKLISATCVVLWGFLSDYTGSRFAFVLGPLVSVFMSLCSEMYVLTKLVDSGTVTKWDSGILACKYSLEGIRFPHQ